MLLVLAVRVLEVGVRWVVLGDGTDLRGEVAPEAWADVVGEILEQQRAVVGRGGGVEEADVLVDDGGGGGGDSSRPVVEAGQGGGGAGLGSCAQSRGLLIVKGRQHGGLQTQLLLAIGPVGRPALHFTLFGTSLFQLGDDGALLVSGGELLLLLLVLLQLLLLGFGLLGAQNFILHVAVSAGRREQPGRSAAAAAISGRGAVYESGGAGGRILVVVWRLQVRVDSYWESRLVASVVLH